jgi:signal transduction histidine kinase
MWVIAQLKAAWELLAPGTAEEDPEFRWEVMRLSQTGLRVIAGVEIAFPLILLLVYLALRLQVLSPHPYLQTLPMMAVGVATGLVSFTDWSRWNARLVALASGWLSGAWLIGISLWLTGEGLPYDYLIPGNVVLVLLVAVAAAPFQPVSILGLGLALEAFYVFCLTVPLPWEIAPSAGHSASQHANILMIIALCTVLGGLLYQRRVSDYRNHRESIQTMDYLRRAQSRAMLTENAASLGRLAAALSHEFNSPLGSLKSASATLRDISARRANASPAELERFQHVEEQLYRIVFDSTRRLHDIVTRLQRFTNLDRAEIQRVDINVLVEDVVNLMDARVRERVQLELQFTPLPPITCRPQQLSAALSNLLSNAMEAVDFSNGRVYVTTRATEGHVEIEIRDNGVGLTRDDLARLFDPGFKVSSGRVSTGNWSLFSTRQIIREHGGDIRVNSLPAEGTVMVVQLPAR